MLSAVDASSTGAKELQQPVDPFEIPSQANRTPRLLGSLIEHLRDRDPSPGNEE
jgi:hypothetical protein